MKINYQIILSFCLWFLVINLNAQDPLLRHYTTNDGIPSDKISPMIQDKDGFIWFGTDVGVTRFDGIKFRNFTLSDGLSDSHILKVKTDSKGRVWFLGQNGTVSYWLHGKIYNASSDTLLRDISTTSSDTLLKDRRTTSYFANLFEDYDNRLWFISTIKTVILDENKITILSGRSGIVINCKSGPIFGHYGSPYNSPYFSKYVSGKLTKFELQYNLRPFSRYLPLPDGSVLFLSYKGVVWQEDTVQKLIIPFERAYSNGIFISMALSTDSLVWITVQGYGLYCYDLKIPIKSPKIYLKNKLTEHVLADKEGNIWISTLNEGLYMIPVWGEEVIVFNKENGLSYNQCYSICKLETGELLVGMDEGKVNLISNNKIFNVETYGCSNLNNRVYRILSRNDDVWIATQYGLMHQNKKTGCNHLIDDPEHYNWINGGNGLQRIMWLRDIALGDNKIYIANQNRKFEYPIKCQQKSFNWATRIEVNKYSKNYSIYCDYSGQLWYGTTKGLKSIKDSSFIDRSKEDVLLTKRINSIAETKDSTLVLATHGFGVLFYKNGKIVKRLSSTEGLCNDICRRVFVHKDRIYVCTPSGLSVLLYLNGAIKFIQNLNTNNFLPSNQVNDVFADDEDISVATMNGVAMINQRVFEKIKPIIPLLSITEIMINDSIISLDGENIFSYKNNSLKISFIGINYQKPHEVNYRYRIKEDQSWNTTENTILEFSFLPPGEYIFQIQARVQNGNWSPVKSFAFTIKPPFWNTFWFRLLVILFLLFLGYCFVKRSLKKRRKKQEEKVKIEKQIAALEQQALQTMMNPHFIFNVMNSIQSFINTNDKEAANQYLADFATLIRMNLAISYKKYIPLDEEINYLNLYLKFEKLRFGNNLTYEIIADPNIDTSESTIAVMMIQPFIENAVWHGILPIKDKGHIHVQIDKDGDDLIKIKVEDDGIGIDQKYLKDDFLSQINESHGLSMTMQRLILLGKSSVHELYIRYKHLHPEMENKGTIAELVLPAMFY